ncbi:MAG: TetR/AcrR family transcriptional regulator [Leptospira sp.]|nr:TetR/AcrR family transcriptional regulator [Leptospira sp.]
MIVQSKRENNKKENQAQILEAARYCFLEHGFESVTIRDVIRRTNLASGTFYNYYKDKESLLRAVVAEPLQKMNQELREVRKNSTDTDDFIYNAYHTLFLVVAGYPDEYRIILRNEPAVRGLIAEEIFGIPMKDLKNDLTRAAKKGLIPKTDTDFLAAAFYGTGYEMIRVLVERKNFDIAKAASFAAQVFLKGILS